MRKVPVIVLTGGPCAGKTTILVKLQQKLGDLGYVVITLSEVATDLISSGIYPGRLSVEDFQTLLLKHMIAKEDYWKEAAQLIDSDKVVIIADRGTLDSEAYVPKSVFERMIGNLGYTRDELSDERYDAIIFAHSVAVDKSHIYTLANNSARKETIEQAKALDAKTLSAWTGHRHLRVVDNSEDIDGKAQRVFQEVTRVLGIPVPLEIENKYLVRGADLSKIPHPMQEVRIGQYYLDQATRSGSSGVERIRSRSQKDGVTYYHTRKTNVAPGVRAEVERIITEKEYLDYLKRADPEFSKIEKTRYCFCFKGQYFELDVFVEPRGLVLLEIELTEQGQEVFLPDFLQGKVFDVTHDPYYSNKAIAKSLAQGVFGP